MLPNDAVSPAPPIERMGEGSEWLDSRVDQVSARLESKVRIACAELGNPEWAEPLALTLAGGKRLRARLALLVAHSISTPDSDFLVRACVSIELQHAASLIHDDIIDRASLRRGQPTLHRLTNPETAILVGDLLASLATEEVAGLGAAAVTASSRAFTQLCLGQLSESSLGWGADAQPGIEEYARRKTGGLFGAACALGALASGASAAATEAFWQAGEALGMAFQLTDDLLDVHNDLAQLDKDHGSDLRNGVPTLPIWHAHHAVRASPRFATLSADEQAGRLAIAADSPAARAFTHARISELVESFLQLGSGVDRPELLVAAATLVLPGTPPAAPLKTR